MKISFWNQYFVHEYLCSLPRDEIIERLKGFYSSKKPKSLELIGSKLRVEKGSIWASLFCIGPETWCKNITEIEIKETSDGSKVIFNINLKLPGFTVGKNCLLVEASSACNTLQ